MKTQTLTITVKTAENNSTFSINSDLNPYEQLGVLELAKLQTFRQINGCSVNSIERAVSKPTLKTLGKLMIDDSDFTDSFSWDKAKRQIKVLNSKAYKGFSDWRLPTKEELNLMYENRDAIGGFSSSLYWSSSEYSAISAWNQNFYNGFQNYNNKINFILVRCVRAV